MRHFNQTLVVGAGQHNSAYLFDTRPMRSRAPGRTTRRAEPPPCQHEQVPASRDAIIAAFFIALGAVALAVMLMVNVATSLHVPTTF